QGNFVVVWTTYAPQDGSGTGIVGRRFDSTGVPLGAEFQVNVFTTGNQYFPRVAMSASGSFVVVWSTNDEDGSYSGVIARAFDSAGSPLGGDVVVNTYTTGIQDSPRVATDDVGDFAVVWTSRYQDGSGLGVFGRRFDSAGFPLGGEFQVNTYTTSYQFYANIGMNGAGDFVVAWSSYQNGDSDIFARRYDASGAAV